jgi:tetratricopeptide (TPR) repeat protein
MRKIPLILLVLIASDVFSQNRIIDSLEQRLKKSPEDTNKIFLMNSLAWEYKNQAKDTGKAFALLNDAIRISEKLGFPAGKAQSFHYMAFTYRNMGHSKLALKKNEEALAIRKKIKDYRGMAKSYNNIGLIYSEDRGDLTKALYCYLEALKLNELIKDSVWVANNNMNLGLLYQRQKNPEKALESFNRALKIRELKKEKIAMADIYNGIGNVYRDKGDVDKGLEFYEKALKISEEENNEGVMAVELSNIGNVYAAKSQPDLAYKYIKKGLMLREKIGNKSAILVSYINLAPILNQLGRLNESEQLLTKALLLAEELDNPEKKGQVYKIFSDLFAGKKDYERSLNFYRQYSAMNDSVYKLSNTRQIAEMQTEFETENKEKEILLQKSLVSKKEVELKQETTQKYAFVGGFTLMIILAAVSFKSYRAKQKANKIMALQKHELEEKQKEILDSIRYAQRIQTAHLPTQKYIHKSIDRLNKN